MNPGKRSDLRAWLVHRMAGLLEIPESQVSTDRPFEESGLSSRDAVALSSDLADVVGETLSPTLLWENPTIDRLVGILSEPAESGPAREVPGVDSEEAVAVVGLGCRFPGGVRGPDQFWELLRDGIDGVGTVPAGRWESFAASRRDAGVLSRLPRSGGFLDDVDAFDAEFFGVSPREAVVMDPQQRLLLEVAWEAMEHAGIPPESVRASPTGVFVGVSAPEYGHLTTSDLAGVDAWTGTGAALSVVANRLSYFLDLRGPSVVVDTACSSSLVAIHQACASLRAGESSTALAGGVNTLLSPAITANFERAGGLAADGRCKAFDAAADGIVRGEGCGVVVLKRLSDASRDGDRVLAVIRGSAVNSDGRSNGLMAPNPASQKDLLKTAYQRSDVEPSSVDYVEAHGTGTLLGDPIEAEALGAALGDRRDPERPLLVGSVKTNIGHLEAASGIAGLIKVVLAMSYGQLPPTLHYSDPNPYIRFEQQRLEVVHRSRNWPKYSGIARAGVSGFGFGGTNAHVVLDAWPRMPVRQRGSADADRVHTLMVSGASDRRMRRHAGDLADWMETPEGRAASLEDVGYTLMRRRAQQGNRGAAVARGRVELVAALRGLARGEPVAITGNAATPPEAVVWVFSGYGSQWSGMCQGLLRDEPAFDEALRSMDPEFARQCGFSLYEALSGADPFEDVGRTQVILFGVQVALAELWRSYRVEPAAVIGHSMGEVAAAVVAGALDFADGLRVMRIRSAILSEVDTGGSGAMAAVEASPEQIAEISEWFPGVVVAVHTSPQRCTVAGPADEVGRLAAHMEGQGRMARILDVSGAGHTAAVDPHLDRLTVELGEITTTRPATMIYSTASEDPREQPSFDSAYWARNLRSPVRFSEAVRAAADDGLRAFVEISPHPVAITGIEETLAGIGVSDPSVTYSCRRDTDDTTTFHTNLALLRVRDVAPPSRYPAGQLVDLPLSTWEHQKYWVAAKPGVEQGHPLLGAYVELPDGRHAWRADIGIGTLPWLADHKVHDMPVLPGAAYVEMAFAASSQILGTESAALRIERLELHRFLPIEDSVPVTTTLVTTGRQAARVEVHTKAATGKWTCHAVAEVESDSTAQPVVPEPSVRGDPVELYESLRAAGQQYGAAFQGVRAVRAVAGTAVAEVVLPDEAGDRTQFDLHPVLLDSCLQGLVAAALGPEGPADQGLFVPIELAGIRPYGIMPARVRCHARLVSVSAEVTGSILVTDEDGTPVLEIGTVRARSLAATSVPVPLTGAFLETSWESAPLPSTSTASPGSWLVIGEAGGLVAELRASGDGVVEGAHDRPVAALDRVEQDPASSVKGVIVTVAPEGDIDAGKEAVLAVAGLVRAMVDRSIAGVRLWVLTSGVHPAAWGLRALIRVLAVEHPELRATIVHSEGAPTESLLTELRAESADDEVRWQGTDRRVARLCRTRLEHLHPEEVVQPGAYVIAGGLGGLGLTLANWLVERGARRVVLNGRGAPSPEASEEIARLRRTGAEVYVVTGDVAEEGVAEQLVRHATREGAWLRGVVNAAGVLDDGSVVELNESSLSRVWRPKVLGAWRLHEATAELDLDWWVAFSSAAGLLGSPGQVAYATANAWMDDLARYRSERGLPATSVQWGPWSEVGAAGDALAGVLEPLTPATGLEALEAVIASGRFAIGVAQLDSRRALEFLPGLDRRPFFGQVLTADREAAPDGDAATLDSQEAITRRLVTGIGGILGWDPDRFDVHTPLTMLGLDSLMAMRAKNTVERDFGVLLPVPLLLRGASLDDIAGHLAGQLGVIGEVEAPAGRERTTGPRDATERWLAHLWSQLLDRETVGVTDDFFSIGGDGVLAEKLASQVGERLNEELSVADLFAVPTIERMADQVRDRFEGGDGPIRVLSEGGTRPPLFLFHPAGGPTSVYQPLVRELGGDQPCYGFERVDEIPVLEDKASYYIELIRTIQPEGPYRLAGWSLGGCLAYETARQLADAGEHVEAVALIDTILPLPTADQSHQELIMQRYQRFAEHIERTYGHSLDLPLDEIAELDEDDQIDRVMGVLAEADLGIGSAILRHQYTSYVDARVAERYQPPPYAGRVVLYRAQESESTTTTLDPRYLRTDESLGWDATASRLEVVPVPGNHLSMIDPPNVDVIATHFATVLDPALPGARNS